MIAHEKSGLRPPLISNIGKNMYRFGFLAVLAIACFTGCTAEYVPPQESIPEIPAGRGAGAAGAPGADAMPAAKKPGKLAQP